MDRQYWIRSKPLYGSLKWFGQASQHIVIAEGDGGMAVINLLQQKYPSQPVQGIYVKSTNTVKAYADTIGRLAPAEFTTYQQVAEALASLNSRLAHCKMGARFYVAGTEQFLWSIAQTLRAVGVQDHDIAMELSGTLARSVYCVHCKTITHQARHNIVPCSGCQQSLLIRDHFSRRFGAYMGLKVDAEEPGNVPAIEEVYP